MPNLDSILPHVVPFLLVLFRLGGLIVFSPVLSSPMVPARVKILLAFMFAVAIYPVVPGMPVATDGAEATIDLWSLAPAIVGETLIGLAIGLIGAMPMYAVQLGGQVCGQQIGLGLAGIYNPALDTDSDVVGQLMLYLALAIFAAAGGMETMFIAVVETFGHVPAGAAWAPAQMGQSLTEMMVGLIHSGFEVGLRVSAPVLCILMIETVASAFLMKTMPQINIQSIGFAIKVVLALGILAASLVAVGEVVSDDVDETLRSMLNWAAELGAGWASGR